MGMVHVTLDSTRAIQYSRRWTMVKCYLEIHSLIRYEDPACPTQTQEACTRSPKVKPASNITLLSNESTQSASLTVTMTQLQEKSLRRLEVCNFRPGIGRLEQRLRWSNRSWYRSDIVNVVVLSDLAQFTGSIVSHNFSTPCKSLSLL